MLELFNDHGRAIWWFVLLSGFILVASLILVPWLIIRLPADYFLTERRPHLPFSDRHPVLNWSMLVLKHLLGLLLLIAGLAMLVLPGQGLLTIAAGLLLLNFPGKYRLEARLVRTPSLLKSINWLRRKANVKPLRVKGEQDSDER